MKHKLNFNITLPISEEDRTKILNLYSTLLDIADGHTLGQYVAAFIFSMKRIYMEENADQKYILPFISDIINSCEITKINKEEEQ